MKNLKLLVAVFLSAVVMYSCTPGEVAAPSDQVSSEALSILKNAGFDVTNQVPINFEDGYLVEGDIYIPKADMHSLKEGNRLPIEEIILGPKCNNSNFFSLVKLLVNVDHLQISYSRIG